MVPTPKPYHPLEINQNPGVSELERLDRSIFPPGWGLEMYTSLLKGERTHGWILETVEGNGVGFLCFQRIDDEAEVLRIGVLPEHQGKGLGKRLLEGLLAEMGTHGDGKVFLEVRESNEAARKLYLSCGFEEAGRREKYYSNPQETAVNYVWSANISATEQPKTDQGNSPGKRE